MSENALISGQAVALRIDNLDTDQIMPKQFLRGIDKSGLAPGVLYDLRHDKAGQLNPDFVLNQPAHRGANIIIGGSNFGCGSSREHAVWGMLQYGVQAIVASSFAEIFYSNAMGNRLLLVQLTEDEVATMMTTAELKNAPPMTIDVDKKQVNYGGVKASFPISDRHRSMFLQGVDVIGLTLNHQDEINAFAEQLWAKQPWIRDVAKRMKDIRV
ncbi:3-isopropylmalate dehydratase small subunit [Variovorax sp. HJSM1_2]|uniref:3-isopropylmalate dehydratase small subunit n=1 Tax=Variovorax sp. HJSM1_2 TaxID=3366263 RepID=UPI003BBB2924